MKILHFLLFLLFSQVFFGQSTNWKFYDRLKVQGPNGILMNPWSGSLNNAQINSIDLNFDGLEDLWIFDRVAQRSVVFRQENKQWVYDYSLEKQLPDIVDWLLLVDFDGDGKKDIFTSSVGGIKVLRNNSDASNLRFSLVSNQLLEQGFSGIINLYVSPTDIPLIRDIDGDGDVDILAFESAGHTIEWHENTSIDSKKIAGLEFKKNNGCWGNLVVQDCSSIFLNQGCQLPALQSVKGPQLANQVLHSGNTLAGFFQNNQFQIWMGHVGCPNVAVLKNEGTGSLPYFSSVIKAFPTEKPLSVPFPATFFVDTNFDGQLEAIVTPNSSDNLGYSVDFKQSVFRLDQAKGSFLLSETNFLQNSSIDVGENASPLFWDVDGDSDLDLLVGNALGEIYFYENKDETFVFKSDNFGNVASLKPGKELKLALANFGGREVAMAISQTGNNPMILVLEQNSVTWKQIKQNGLIPYDQVYWQDIDFDGQKECLVLHRSGRVDLMDVKWNDTQLDFKVILEDWGALISQRFILQSFVLMDEKGEGQLSLMGIDREGQFRKAKFANSKFEFLDIDPEFKHSFGRNTFLQQVDLNKDGRMDLAVGHSGGGIQLFENKNQSSVYDAQDLFQTWPNPTDGLIFVRSREAGSIQLIDPFGRVFIGDAPILRNQTIQLSLSILEPGTYFIKFQGEKGGSQVRKIKVYK